MGVFEQRILQWLATGETPPPRFVIVAAHPDDETIGAGGRLDRLRDATFVYLTDGSPRNCADALAAGFATREAYAAARAEELANALSLAGVERANVRRLNYIDQESAFNMVPATHTLARWLGEIQPDAVLTHPYEGGHPDHDTAALAVYAARRILQHSRRGSPAVVEMTSYHRRGGRFETAHFLPCDGKAVAATLSPAERRLKARLFDCYRTQAKVLKDFSIDVERFRLAPDYDFAASPHPGALHYETSGWEIDGTRWRRLATAALQRMELA